MIWTEEAAGNMAEDGLGVMVGQTSVLFARDQAEALRYRGALEGVGIEAVIGEPSVIQALGVPVFVSADERERADEVLSTLYIESAWDDEEEEDEFEDEEDEDEEEFFPDDVDDFEEEEEEEDEDEDLD
jgi:hypothetical protein